VINRSVGLPVITALAAACAVTPLTNKVRIGEEPFVIAVGEAPDSMTDLFAAPAGGGAFARLTFNRAEEHAPSLAPGGTSVAYFRRSEPASDRWSLIVLDLLTNREESTPVPEGAGKPLAVGWTRDGSRLLVRSYGHMVSAAPPGALWLQTVSLDSIAWADSVTTHYLGEPPAARIGVCPHTGYCIFAVNGEVTELERGISGPIRWGPDSLAYVTPTGFEIRPLSGGRARRPIWTGTPAGARAFTYNGGSGVRSPQ